MDIKELKEKLAKKNARIRELNKKIKELKSNREWRIKRVDDLYEEKRALHDKIYDLQKLIPIRYYEVTWSGVNEGGTRNPPVTETHEAYTSHQLIERLKQKWKAFKLISIKETAS